MRLERLQGINNFFKDTPFAFENLAQETLDYYIGNPQMIQYAIRDVLEWINNL